MSTIENKKTLLTGGTAGIGRAIASKLAAIGHQVTIIGRSKQKLDDVYRDTQNMPGSIEGVLIDLSETAAVAEMVKTYLNEHGCPDVLINNAGLPYKSVLSDENYDLEYLLKTNLWSYLELSRLIGKSMIEYGIEGDIVCIGSMSAESKDQDSSAYVATKSGIRGFAESFRKEVNPHNIRVSLIEPGSVGSDMQPTSPQEEKELQSKLEMLNADDIADTVLFVLGQPRRTNIVSMEIKPLRQFI